MLGKFFIFFLLLLSGSAPAVAQGVYLEIEPLKTAFGELAAGMEYWHTAQFGVGLSVSDIRQEGELDHHEDRYSSLSLQGLYNLDFYGSYFGGGVIWQHWEVGRQQERSSVANVNPYSDNLYDRWVNVDDYLCLAQIVGVRFELIASFLLGLRYTVNEYVWKQQTTTNERLLSYKVDTKSKGRSKVQHNLAMSLGVIF